VGPRRLNLRRVVLVLNQERGTHENDHHRREQQRDDGFDEREAVSPARYQSSEAYEYLVYVGAPALSEVRLTMIW
jgi:hypothetical protein